MEDSFGRLFIYMTDSFNLSIALSGAAVIMPRFLCKKKLANRAGFLYKPLCAQMVELVDTLS
ncbi:MAG: hypothetical protein IKS68_07280 [Mailhella sp.]|nr:hypothetical protein [Mailhella sp.]